MKKLAKLLGQVDLFYKQAFDKVSNEPVGYYMPDEPEEVEDEVVALTGNVSVDAEKFDIKDEDLYSQFESLMSAYDDLMSTLSIDPEHLNAETMEEAAALIDVLNTRYERIISNPYLNSDDDYSEDFSPATLTEFIQNVVNDAESKLKEIAGEDVSVDEVIANQYAQEFNQQMIDKGDKSVTYTGNKVQQLLEARKQWFQNLMFIKKVGKSHPQYQRYESYIESRRRIYKNKIESLKKNPEKYQEYKNNQKARERSLYAKRTEEIQKLLLIYNSNSAKIGLLPNGMAKSKLLDENAALKAKMTSISKYLSETKQSMHHVRRDKEIQDRAELKSSGSLKGLNLIFKQKAQSSKSEVKKKLLKNIDRHPDIVTIRQKIEAAFIDYKREPTSEKRAHLESLQKADKQLKDELASKNPILIKATADIDQLEMFRKIVDQIVAKNELIMPRAELLGMGQELIEKYSEEYKTPCEALSNVLESLRNL